MFLNIIEQFVWENCTVNTTAIVYCFYLWVLISLYIFSEYYWRGYKNLANFLLVRFFYSRIFSQFTNIRFNRYAIPLLCVFFIILGANLIGTVMYSFTFTSALVFTTYVSVSVVTWTFLLGVARFNINFLSLLAPIGTPGFLAKTLVFIELVSLLSRVISLNVRLFINIVSGHLILKLLLSFIHSIFTQVSFFSTGQPLFLIWLFVFAFLVVAVFALETFISILQAYIFVFLSNIYLQNVTW